jgi:hypothetical protein
MFSRLLLGGGCGRRPLDASSLAAANPDWTKTAYALKVHANVTRFEDWP